MPSDASSDEESVEMPQPKIPPPPSEQPPPYTPFGGQTTSLLPSTSASSPPTNVPPLPMPRRTATVVRGERPTGFQKYAGYLTKRNIIIGTAVVISVVILAIIIHFMNVSDENLGKKDTLPGTKQLEMSWLALGALKNFDQKMSFDENTKADSIMLSKYEPMDNVLKSEKIYPDTFQDGFIRSTQNISEKYTDCVRFTDEVLCCSTSSHDRHHRTDCYISSNGTERRAVAVKYDFLADWQSLADGNKLLIVYNRQRHAVFDIQQNKVHKIEENRLPHGYLSVGFFFPMESDQELDELVRSGQEFRVCSYLKTTYGDYALKDENCRQTPFTVEFELPKVKFCSNPLYTAVVQYGHYQSDKDFTWHLRVKYDSAEDVYSATETLESIYEQLVMDCNDETLDVYVVGTAELHQFTVKLPNLRQEHFIQTRRI